MPQENREYKRRNYFIKRDFQFRFILKFCLILLAGVVLSTLLVFVFSQETLTSSFDNSRLVIKSTGQAIMPTLLATNMVTLAIIALAAIAVTLFVSHRIAGPMYRFEQDIQKVAAGDLTVKIHLRRKDQFSEMAKAFNQMSSNMNKKLNQIDRDLEKLLTPGTKPETTADFEKQIRDLKEKIQQDFNF